MTNLSFFSYKRTRHFLLILVYLIIVFLISPISLALFLSTLFTPLIQWCYRKTKIPYLLIILASSILAFGVAYVIIQFIVNSFLLLLPQLQFYLTQDFFNQPILAEISTLSMTFIEQFSSFAIITIKNVFHYIFEVFIFLMTFFFSLLEGKRNPYWFFAYVPASVRTTWKNYYARAMQLFTTLLFVELRLLLLTFALLALGFILLDFSYPIQKALLIAVADCLPFFGIGIVMIPLAIYFYFADSLLLCVATTLLYVFIQTTRQLTESYLWASTFHVRTVHTFIISATSVLLFGFYGILLSPFILLFAVKLKEQPIFAR